MNKLALIVLDGFGIGENKPNNAIYMSRKPFFTSLWKNYPHTKLQASGEYVGLPEGQIGGSEVGHLTLGAGRVLYQDLPRINRSLDIPDSEEYILKNPQFIKLIALAKENTLHLIGLISPGGIHSHHHHLHRILEIMKEQGCKSPIIHFISDGRDTPPTAGITYAKQLIELTEQIQFGTVVSLAGRFYTMDRDTNWDRTQKAVDLIVSGKALHQYSNLPDWQGNLTQAFQKSYDSQVTDEFIETTLIDPNYTGIKENEPLFFFNFRADRMKQIVTKVHATLPENPIYTMTQYDKNYDFPILFGKQHVTNTLPEIISTLGLKQLRAAETEKIPHVTYFFNGGVEIIFSGEIRAFAQSNRVTHDHMPDMKAHEIVENVKKEVEKEKDIAFVLVNFANADMVGHTGKFPAVVQAVETTDSTLQDICEYLTEKGYICVITADHGNADIEYDLKTLEPHTAHTLNVVPFVIYAPEHPELQKIKLDQNENNGLSKVAGTVLEIMGIEKPEKDYESLIV